MQIDLLEGDGMGRFVVSWDNDKGSRTESEHDFYTDALTQYFHLVDLNLRRKPRLIMKLLPLPRPRVVPDEEV